MIIGSLLDGLLNDISQFFTAVHTGIIARRKRYPSVLPPSTKVFDSINVHWLPSWEHTGNATSIPIRNRKEKRFIIEV